MRGFFKSTKKNLARILINAVSDFLAQAPEVRVEEVCGGIALSRIDALVFTQLAEVPEFLRGAAKLLPERPAYLKLLNITTSVPL